VGESPVEVAVVEVAAVEVVAVEVEDLGALAEEGRKGKRARAGSALELSPGVSREGL